MGVERNFNNDVGNAVSTRCNKTSSVDIYRPPALRCQSYESTDTIVVKNDRKNESNSTTTTTIANSVSCNNSPIHANENKICNTLTSPTDAVAVLAHVSMSDQQSKEEQTTVATTAANRRERRPDRAVYIPRARRSQTTPPAATTLTANNANEQQLPITLNSNGLVLTPPSSKVDEFSKNAATKKSKTTKERKERTKKTSNKQLATLELSAKNDTSEAEQETKEEKYCDISKHRLGTESYNTKNTSLTNKKNLNSLVLPKETTLESNAVVGGSQLKIKSDLNNMAECDEKYPNVHIEDVIATEIMLPKCDIDQQELQRASKEINRSNRRIMKQTFVSDVLEIPEKIDKISSNKKAAIYKRKVLPKNNHSNVVTTTDDEEEDDDWENMFDESGDCLDPKILQELTASVGKVKIELPKMDYTAYLTKQSILNEEEFPHVLEVSNFPVEFKNQDLLMLFSQYKESGFDIKWVDDTHALAIFSSSRIAAEVLAMGHPFVVVKPLAEATMESRLKAKKCAASLQPYRPRPETCAALARRLVTGALGVRLKTAAAERENEKRVLREAKERKLLAAKQREEIWES